MSKDLEDRRPLADPVTWVAEKLDDLRAGPGGRCRRPKSASVRADQISDDQDAGADLQDRKADRHRVRHGRRVAFHVVRRWFAMGQEDHDTDQRHRRDRQQRTAIV